MLLVVVVVDVVVDSVVDVVPEVTSESSVLILMLYILSGIMAWGWQVMVMNLPFNSKG